ncbi:MAG: SusC/RagA family TonB-linked outer membrane protein [Cyclobacteriaceae bacterium]
MKISYKRPSLIPIGSYFCLWVFLVMSLSVSAQSITVRGKVTDGVTNEALPGVSILVKDTQTGTITDLDGNYQLTANPDDVLIFSFVGFRKVEVPVTGSTVNVALEEDYTQLGEVVVIGYGTTTVEDATGAITSITQKDFNQGNIVTPENLLNGRVAGLTINTSGAPGGGSTIRIRGGSSLDASNDPLIVINGLPIDNNAVGGSSSVLSSINPNDIESFTVLKDASATAIYGSRASNGVIIITTKQAGKDFQFNFDSQVAVNTLASKVDVFGADEYRELVQENYPDLVDRLGDANTDWQDEIYQNALTTTFNAAAQGSLLGKVPTRVSLGRTDQEGLRLTSDYARTSASINMNPKFFDNHLRVAINANGVLEENRFAPGEEGNAITFDPTQPVYDPESPWGGFFQYYDREGFDVLAPRNPVANLLLRNDESEVQRLYGNVQLDYSLHFLPDLSITANLGLDDARGEGSIFESPDLPIQQPDGSFLGSSSNYWNEQSTYLLDSYLDYSKDINQLHIEATAGYSYQRFTSGNFNSGDLTNDLPSTDTIRNEDTDLVLIGFFGRTNIAFNDKYLLTLSFRRDGSSRFSELNRWGNFPAAAFAWKIRDELFPDSKTFSTMKLRLGWGVTGQQDFGRLNRDVFLQRYVVGQPASQYQFGNQVIPIGVPSFRNEDLRWEETTTWNVGLDYGLFDDRVTGSVEAFYKISDDLFAIAPISEGSNFSNEGAQNIGSFTSRGIEFAVNADVLRSETGFNWNVNYNFTLLEVQIDELAVDNTLTGGIGGGTGGTVQIRRVGFAPNAFYVYKQVYNEEGLPIEGAYADLNGDNQITDADRYIPNDANPNLTMGFLSNMNYRNFDLSFNLRAHFGNNIYNNVRSSRAQLQLIQNNSYLANLPLAVLESGFTTTEDVILSDYYIEDASFLRMDNITLGYTFRELFSNSSNLRFTLGVQNPFVISNYTGIDPEIFNGIDNTIYPRPRTYYVGANLSF